MQGFFRGLVAELVYAAGLGPASLGVRLPPGPPHKGHVAELVYATDLKSEVCGFDSRRAYHTKGCIVNRLDGRLWKPEAAGSSPAIPTIFTRSLTVEQVALNHTMQVRLLPSDPNSSCIP